MNSLPTPGGVGPGLTLPVPLRKRAGALGRPPVAPSWFPESPKRTPENQQGIFNSATAARPHTDGKKADQYKSPLQIPPTPFAKRRSVKEAHELKSHTTCVRSHLYIRCEKDIQCTSALQTLPTPRPESEAPEAR